jgi:hypothetical protein
MKHHLRILYLALLPGVVGGQETKTYPIAENNVIIRLADKREESAAREILTIAASAKQQLAAKYQIDSTAPVEIRLSATTYEFCRMTGRPWWQASIYRSRVIYLQPLRILRGRGILETTLRHEVMHQLVDELGKGNSPVWLSEALSIYNSGEIAFLKPAKKKVKSNELEWLELERRLAKTANQTEAENLYFQLYHLGRFIETRFAPAQIAALLIQLGGKTAFAQACENVFGINASEIEQSWLQFSAESLAK